MFASLDYQGALAKLIVYLAVRPICVAEVVIRDSVLVNNDVGEETKYSYKKAAPQKAVVPRQVAHKGIGRNGRCT